MSRSGLRRITFVLRNFAAALAGLAAVSNANAQVVISQLYGAGGASGANWRNDFIELYNRGNTPVDLSTWSVQYAPAAGTNWQRTDLVGSIPAHSYYLVQESGGTIGQVMPPADAFGIIGMNPSDGKVALVSNQTTLPAVICFAPGAHGIVDFVGYGGLSNGYEGGGPTLPPTGNTTAAFRKNGGCQDNNYNLDDFFIATTAPRNSNSTINPCFVGAVGACCLSGECVQLSAFDCAKFAGAYSGDNTYCQFGEYVVANRPAALEDISADPNAVNITGLGDDGSSVQTVPFDFKYFGYLIKAGANMWINANGLLAFGINPLNTPANNPFPTFGVPNNFISPYWDNLVMLANPTPLNKIQWTVYGEAPDRRMIVQWTNMRTRISATSGGNLSTFQIIIHETSNIIEFRYGAVQANGTGSPIASINVGLEANDGLTGVNIAPADIGSGGDLAARQFYPVGPADCACGPASVDSDNDGTPDCADGCPNDPFKIEPGVCGCGVSDVDSDGDGAADCIDGCPDDPLKIAPGQCGCGEVEDDADTDGVADCVDNCIDTHNPDQADCDGDGIGDACVEQADCNENGILDSCDIASGASLDENLNGVPDECENSTCPADLAPAPPDGDGNVNVDDLLVLLQSWGACISKNCPADLAPPQGDGNVDVDDLLVLLQSWGPCAK